MPKSRVDNRDFVVAWTTSQTIEDVMKATGMSVASIRARAKFLKDKGVKLKKLNRPNIHKLDALDIAQLNSLINKYTNTK